MGKIEQINNAINKAENLESKITDECFTIGGYTSPKIRHLMNNLGAINNNYLEVGTHRGALFIATGYKNENINLTAIDNFSELAEDGTVKNEFLDNCEKFITNWKFIEKDCFTVTPKEIKNKIDLYLFDGNHSLESHKKALTHFKPMLADEFILVVDDFNWEQVKEGTTQGIFSSKMEILYQAKLGAEGSNTEGQYHNGILIALIKNK